jgi:GNAT superfamily N-acetyltransferase
MEIRKMTMADLSTLAPLAVSLVKTQRLPFKVGGTKCVEGFSDSFLRNPKGVCYGAVTEAGNVVGWIGACITDYVFSDEEMCHIRAWDVQPEFRAEGIGGLLLEKVKQWAVGMGVSLLTCGVNVASSINPEYAVAKLHHEGFQELERFFIKRLPNV